MSSPVLYSLSTAAGSNGLKMSITCVDQAVAPGDRLTTEPHHRLLGGVTDGRPIEALQGRRLSRVGEDVGEVEQPGRSLGRVGKEDPAALPGTRG